MRISNFIDTIKSNNTIQWNTFEKYIVTDKDDKSIMNIGRDNAAEQKYCQSLSKYNNETLTNEELSFIKKVKSDIGKTKEVIGRILSDVTSEVENKINQFDVDKNFSLSRLKNKYNNGFNDEKDLLKESLRGESNSIISKSRHLKHFRLTNNLVHRDADYPSSKLYFWGIFFVVLVFEAVANAYFYAQGSDLGLLGGVLQAFLVAIANVFLSFGIGFILFRYMNHISIFKKTMAIFGTFISFFLLSFLHLVTAHYRELLIKFPDDAAQKVLSSTWNDPFNIQDMDSLILIIIGFTISIIVMWKAYRYDDPYPSYGKEWRRWEETQIQKNKHISKFKTNLNIMVDDFENDIDRLNNNIKRSTEDFDELLAKLKGFKTTVEAYCQGTLESAIGLSRSYRTGYNAVAEQDALLSNSTTDSIVEQYLELENILSDMQEKINFSEHKKKEYMEIVEEIHKEKGKVIEAMKSLKDNLVDDANINELSEEALATAHKQQEDIGSQ